MYSDNITQKIAEAAKKIMDEQLKGNQHKIDANKNGKIDAEDFKLLKAKKEVKQEETEQIDEVAAEDYAAQNVYDKAHMAYMSKHKDEKAAHEHASKMMKQKYPHHIASKGEGQVYRLSKEEIEQLDELSKKTLGSYVNRAANQAIIKGLANPADKSDDMKTIDKREKGIRLATYKLTKEEQEFIDELNKGTLGSYVNAAARDAVHRTAKEVETGRLDKLADKRMKGIKLATKKLAKEETEQIDEGTYKSDVEKAFPASGVKTIEPKHKYSTMPKDKAKGVPAGSVGVKSEGYYKDIDTNRKEDERLAAQKKKELPFTPDKSAKKVATAGKFGYGYSAARHLARKGMASVTKEEVEQIDELSKKALSSYASAAEDDLLQKQKAIKNTPGSATSLKHARSMDMYKRMGNIAKAYKKIIAKEETEQVDEAITKTSTGYIHHARPGVYGGSEKEKHVVDTLTGPKRKELDAIEKEKKMKKFSEMLDLINSQGLKALSEMIKEEPDNEQFTQELKDQQAKSEGKGKKAEVAKGAVQAVQQEETHTQVEVLDFDSINGVKRSTIDLEERHLTEPETKKKEEIVKSMKKGLSGFKARYGDRAKEVMYATATKQAKGE